MKITRIKISHMFIEDLPIWGVAMVVAAAATPLVRKAQAAREALELHRLEYALSVTGSSAGSATGCWLQSWRSWHCYFWSEALHECVGSKCVHVRLQIDRLYFLNIEQMLFSIMAMFLLLYCICRISIHRISCASGREPGLVSER